MQYEFGFLGELRKRPKFPERLFYSVFPDVERASRIGEFTEWLMRKYGIQGKRLNEERLHVSLQHVGDYKRLRSKFIYAAVQAGNAIASDPFEISFHAVASFETPPMNAGKNRHRPAVLLGESEELKELNGNLTFAMTRLGLKATDSFVPHMTMFYGRPMLPEMPIEPFRFAVDEFTLVHSKRGLTQYEIIERWPLKSEVTFHSPAETD